MIKETELAIVGAGPAGLSAAIEAARAGVRVTLIDENPKPGGQLVKQIHKFFGSQEHYAGVRGLDIATRLWNEARSCGVELMMDSVVWGLFGRDRLGVIHRNRNLHLKADRIILATGATENALAFPGWTLPGVLGAGAIQTLMNVHRVLPGRRVIMVGSGNVGLIVSYQLLQAGAQVLAVLEAAPKVGGYEVHANKLRRNGVPILTSTTIKEARGKSRVEKAASIGLDPEWREIRGTEKEYDVDVICLAVGLAPMSELAWMAGCRFEHIPELGGQVPVRSATGETTVPGILVAGDVAGIAEASTALEEGRIAGIAVAEALGYLPPAEARARKAVISKRLDALPKLPSATVTRGADGRPRRRELAELPGMPSRQRLSQGAVAVIECAQEVPCNPCEAACPFGAIRVGEPISNLPALAEDKCTGCGHCLALCPGQAIFVIDTTYSDHEATVQLPYEFLPLPTKGDPVVALNRQGESVCPGRVVKVANTKKLDHTPLITIAIPKEHALGIRNIAAGSRRGTDG